MSFKIGIPLFHFQLKSIIDARRLYLQLFGIQNPGIELQFPLKEMDIKSFSVCLCRAGFTFSRIINNIYRGQDMEHILDCIGMETPRDLQRQ